MRDLVSRLGRTSEGAVLLNEGPLGGGRNFRAADGVDESFLHIKSQKKIEKEVFEIEESEGEQMPKGLSCWACGGG